LSPPRAQLQIKFGFAKDRADSTHFHGFIHARHSAYQSAVEEALQSPPPATVRAYEAVNGRIPDGWAASA
jgi:hypothetical protein